MWCPQCESDVAAEVSPETGQVACAVCGETLSVKSSVGIEDQVKQAQDLLQRWAKDPLLEPSGYSVNRQTPPLDEPVPPETVAEADQPTSEQADVQAHEQIDEVTAAHELEELPDVTPVSPARRPTFRFDAAHDPVELKTPVTSSRDKPTDKVLVGVGATNDSADGIGDLEEPFDEHDPESSVPTVPEKIRVDPPRAGAAAAPHLDIQELIEERQQTRKGINWMLIAGQWLAYLGVLGLTAGGSMVIYSYFGGATAFAPKGWMLTTAGQMLLFLGIVTLISSGIEKSNEEVNDRIEIIGEQLLRFERETKEQLLRGPKIPPRAYEEGASSATTETEKSLTERGDTDV